MFHNIRVFSRLSMWTSRTSSLSLTRRTITTVISQLSQMGSRPTVTRAWCQRYFTNLKNGIRRREQRRSERIHSKEGQVLRRNEPIIDEQDHLWVLTNNISSLMCIQRRDQPKWDPRHFIEENTSRCRRQMIRVCLITYKPVMYYCNIQWR